MSAIHHPLAGLTVLERGWLSSNNLLIHAAPGEAGAVLVDSGHVNHAAQTVALVRHALDAVAPAAPLARIINTHLHSDHCGGNAALQTAFGAPVSVPPGQAAAVMAWHDPSLSWHSADQRIERFSVQQVLQPGQPLRAGGRDWQVLEAPGHDPDSVMLFDAANGVLVSADALWENGFGVVFPEIAGEPGFDDVGAVLDLIASLPVRLVLPGHGAPFSDVAAALARARSRLAAFQADPLKHARHGVRALLTYHLMEERQQRLDALLDWALAAPLFAQVWQQLAPAGGTRDWLAQQLHELVRAGVLRIDGDMVHDA